MPSGRVSQFAHPVLLGVTLAATMFTAACADANTGRTPPADRLWFPQGVALDPRTPPGEAARYLFVNTGNNDLTYNSGWLVAFDLEAFFAAWATDPGGGDLSPYPYCEAVGAGPCVLGVGAAVDVDRPCRRLPFQPRIVECEESRFVAGEGQRIGTFSTEIATSTSGGTQPRIWIPVRNEPSITYADVGPPDPSLPPEFFCGESPLDRCDSTYRLTRSFNDPDDASLAREPFTILIDEQETHRYAYVAHLDDPLVSVIDLDGLERGVGQKDGVPAIVDTASVFVPPAAATGAGPGGFGLAVRPCPDDAQAPTATGGCRWPLVYGGLRQTGAITSFAVAGRTDACVGDLCIPHVNVTAQFAAIGNLTTVASQSGALGDLVFADDTGELLYVVQTSPGALLRVDTSVDERGVPRNLPMGAPLELCELPSRLQIWREESLAFVTCFDASTLMIVDLEGFRLADILSLGTGPNDMALDPVRRVLYVGNTLEASISVIHLDRGRPTFLQEVARIGLQEPFSQ